MSTLDKTFEVFTDGVCVAHKKVSSAQEVFDFAKSKDFFPCKKFLIIYWDLGRSTCVGITRDRKGRYVKADRKKFNTLSINRGDCVSRLLGDLLGLFNAAI